MLLDSITSSQDIKHYNSDQLLQLCKELRSEIINIVSQTGGHLGASLGVIELTVALHYVFNTPTDRLIWDVGHQSYPHKILTGRRDKMSTLRQKSGLSGFTRREENLYDCFGAGHSSTSISAGLGMEIAKILSNKQNRVISVIGDGAISAGMAYEAINNAGSLGNRLIVILNDNNMSISPAVGAMSSYLSQFISSRPYLTIRDTIKASISKFPGKKLITRTLQKLEKNFKSVTSNGNIFEELGFYYIGPLDGHNVEDLVRVLQNVRNDDHSINKPILIHVITEKGKGFSSPENSLEKFHAVGKFCPQTKIQKKNVSAKPTYTNVFSKILTDIAIRDDKIIAITAAMASGTGLDKFQQQHPNRFFDVGIAEQHAVTFAAGLACEGYKPFVAIYSTFLQRAYDQIVHDVAIQKLPVKFAIDRAGLVGADGATHAGSFDITYLGTLPNFIIMAASDEQELANMILTASEINNCPVAFRYPRGEIIGNTLNIKPEIIAIGKGRIIQEGNDVAILSLGTRLQEAQKAADLLVKEYGITCTIADARFAKPIDQELIKNLAQNHALLVTIEEGSIGGFASYVNNYLLQNDKFGNNNLLIRNLFLPDEFIEQATQYEQYEEAGLNAEHIFSTVVNILHPTIKQITRKLYEKAG
jgi:1-deoxy-D-xylulose-5-phosphate synthase